MFKHQLSVKNHSRLPRSAGLTLIELMVTVSIAAILAALAVPNLNAFLVKNQASSISSEFARDINRVRIEAISRNACVSICQSTTAGSTDSNNPPSCSTTGSDWNRGWLVFEDSTCLGTVSEPDEDDLIMERQTGSSNFTLSPASGSALLRITFNARGITSPVLTDRNFTLAYLPESSTTSKNYRSIVLSSAGHVIIKQY